MSIPLGFRFIPTPEELITCYLLPKALGFQLPCNPHVLEMPLYGENADPTRIFRDVDDSNWVVSEGNDRVVYVLTKLSKINNGKTRISRRAGRGTWSGQTGGKRIKNGSGELIGSVKMFGFEADGKPDDDHHHHWIMHEYSLAGVYSDGKCRGMKHKDYVICKIRRTSSKRKGVVFEDDVVAAPPAFKKLKAGPSIEEYVPVLDVDDRPEESNSRVVGVSEGGNRQPLTGSVFDHRTLIILDDDDACPTGPDDLEEPDFNLDEFEFNLDVLDSFMGSFMGSFTGSSIGACN